MGILIDADQQVEVSLIQIDLTNIFLFSFQERELAIAHKHLLGIRRVLGKHFWLYRVNFIHINYLRVHDELRVDGVGISVDIFVWLHQAVEEDWVVAVEVVELHDSFFKGNNIRFPKEKQTDIDLFLCIAIGYLDLKSADLIVLGAKFIEDKLSKALELQLIIPYGEQDLFCSINIDNWVFYLRIQLNP